MAGQPGDGLPVCRGFLEAMVHSRQTDHAGNGSTVTDLDGLLRASPKCGATRRARGLAWVGSFGAKMGTWSGLLKNETVYPTSAVCKNSFLDLPPEAPWVVGASLVAAIATRGAGGAGVLGIAFAPKTRTAAAAKRSRNQEVSSVSFTVASCCSAGIQRSGSKRYPGLHQRNRAYRRFDRSMRRACNVE
jgi:hypothetical protein